MARNKFMENQPKKLNKALKISAIIGLLCCSAFIINYFYIVLPSQKKSEQKLRQTELTSSDNFLCNRKEPYEMPEEIKRALSLRKQRLEEATRNDAGYLMADILGPAFVKLDDQYRNCYNIQYGDLRLVGGAEGVFWFDDKVSSPNNLQITIDNIYKFNDDLLLAIVLQHEISHAWEFIQEEKSGIKHTCIEKEQVAFMSESLFIRTLNQGEKDSLYQRFNNLENGNTVNNYSKNFFSGLQMLVASYDYAENKCTNGGKLKIGDNQKCLDQLEADTIKKILEKYDYCQEGSGAGNTSAENPTTSSNNNQDQNQTVNNSTQDELEKNNKKATEEQKKQYETQLKLDKKAYDAAVERITLDYNHEVDSLKAKESADISKTNSMFNAAGSDANDEQRKQYIERVKDSYKPQYEYLESVYKSNLKMLDATKYW
jgi:hypothetical protein